MHPSRLLRPIPLLLPVSWPVLVLAGDGPSTKPVNLTTAASGTTQCTKSTFTLAGGQEDGIELADCQALAGVWTDADPFTLLAAEWADSTDDADPFYAYITQGSCEFAFRRTDGVDSTVLIGDADLIGVIDGSIAINNVSQMMQPVEGSLGCQAEDGMIALLEWTVRLT